MEASEIDNSRFGISVDLMSDGVSDLVFNNVSFALNRDSNELEVRSFTTWKANVTDATAFVDLRRGIAAYEHLIQKSLLFAGAVQGFSPRFSLVDDYGSGTVELCYLVDDRIVWR